MLRVRSRSKVEYRYRNLTARSVGSVAADRKLVEARKASVIGHGQKSFAASTGL